MRKRGARIVVGCGLKRRLLDNFLAIEGSRYLGGLGRTLVGVDGTRDDLEAARLNQWWGELSDVHRNEAFRLAPHNPMPTWMVHSLEKAEISGLVERPGEPADMPPWIPMPDHVARLVARHRRGGTYRFQNPTRYRR